MMIKRRITEIYDEMLYRITMWILGHSWQDRSEDIKERIRRLEEYDDSKAEK
jgi:hypothetical protein